MWGRPPSIPALHLLKPLGASGRASASTVRLPSAAWTTTPATASSGVSARLPQQLRPSARQVHRAWEGTQFVGTVWKGFR
jgi:hypothetical protein